MTKNLFALSAIALGLLAAGVATAADVPAQPTFHRDVEPIFQAHCQSCHRSKPIDVAGMVAPFSLTSYQDARPWSKAVAKAVQTREMPPWHATDDFHGVFRNERHLSDAEIDTVVRWVKAGSPEGDLADAPPPLEFPDEKWWLGEPDLIVQLPEALWVGDEVVDWQPNVFIELTEDQLPKDRYVKAIECRPGSDIVHHVVINTMEKGSGDALSEVAGKLIGGLAPGDEPTFAHDGYGTLLKKGTTLRVNMHYNKEAGPGSGVWDQTEMGFYFWPEGEVIREVENSAIGSFDFEIPPGQQEWHVGMARTFDRPFSVHSYLPHMHVRGVAAKYTAIFPDGTHEVLLDVPQYDYNWQTSYEYPQPRPFPAGTRIEVEMVFDNSTANESNPDPATPIHFGITTTADEMALGFLRWTWDDDLGAGATGGAGGR